MASVDYFILAGGASGGGTNANTANDDGGGGSGGGALPGTDSITATGAYPIVVGTGGAPPAANSQGNNGNDSSFNGHTATGGGGGGRSTNGSGGPGANGGSGGGGGSFGGQSGGTGTVGQGNNGGNGSANAGAGGGGGAGGVGQNGTGSTSGNGGAGLTSSISGSSVNYGGGGGGARTTGNGSGTDGGGNGATGAALANGGDGTDGLGGGGGGGIRGGIGGKGGDGVVILSAVAGVITATGGTMTTVGGKDIWTFTSSGTWTITSISGTDTISVSETTVISDTPSISVPKQLSVSNSTAVSESVNISFPLSVKVTDSTAVSDTPTILIANTSRSGLLGSLYSSGYKWLTSTLLTAQQSFAVRPYFTAQIIDDTIQPNATLQNGSGTFAGHAAAMCTAPDGKILGVGYDVGFSSVDFYTGSDLNASSGLLTDQKTIDFSALSVNANNAFAIACSDWLNGTYSIDIWYFSNWANDGTDLIVVRQHSADAGATWTKSTFSVSPGTLPNNTANSISIAAAQPWWDGTLLHFGAFYIKTNANVLASNFTGYDIYFTGNLGTGAVTDAIWSARNVNSGDWVIGSLTAFYINNTQYVCFSGARSVIDGMGTFASFSIWVTAMLKQTNSQATSLWTPPVNILPLPSNAANNENTYVSPTASVVNGMVYLVVRQQLTDSITQTPQLGGSPVTRNFSYALLKSDNGTAFSYPAIFVDTNGNQFNPSAIAFFLPQNQYWYLGGPNGYMWQYIQNNTVADVSSDLIAYEIQEQAGQPSSISLTIANANNKWVGNNPTGLGAAAISGNKKIAIWQGYYTTSSNSPELVPRNIFYIDDIQQKISGTQNDVVITGRDWYKNMLVTVTRFAYQFIGPLFYSDVFDGSTNNNWNQQTGTWSFFGSTSGPTDQGVYANIGSGIAIMTLGMQVPTTPGALTRVFFQAQNTGILGSKAVSLYPLYIDSGNYVRMYYDPGSGTFAVSYRKNGVQTVIASGAGPTLTNGASYALIVRRYDYYKFDYMLSAVSSGVTAGMSAYDQTQPSYALTNVDLTTVINNGPTLQNPFTIALGADTNGAAVVNQFFHHFMHVTYTQRSSISTILQSIARVSSIFSFKFQNTFREYLFAPSFTGVFTVLNRILSIGQSQDVMYNANTFANGEIIFQAKIAPTTFAAGFSFVFRASSASGFTNAYKFHILQDGGAGNSLYCRFERLYSGALYTFFNTEYDMTSGGSADPTISPTLNFDPTQWHTYRIEMIDGQMFAFIDDIMVAYWNDDNTTTDFLTSGYWGFETDANTTLKVQQISGPSFWKPVATFSFNPGDDAESSAISLIQQLRAWFFSDMLGRFKAIFLSSSDPSTYTYNSQLFNQGVDASDKEYVAQVTVFGNPPVMATVRNTNLMPGVPTRDKVIVDYSIVTVTDAETRANQELLNANQYRDQYTPKQIVNVGAEIFDSVTVINTGNNTSGVDGPSRVYAETFTEGGGNNTQDYSLEVDTGNIV